MKKNKGFTLIELLAVLVILAIIALIITPIVTGLIEDAQTKSAANATEGLLDAVDIYYGREMMKTNGVFANNSTVTVEFDGKTGGNTSGTIDGDTAIEFNGFTVDGGQLTIDRYGVITISTSKPLSINGYNCTNPSTGVTCVEQ